MITGEGGPLYLEVEDILALYAVIVGCRVQEAADHLLRVEALEGALYRPLSHAIYGGADLALQAAVLTHGLVSDHPFIDANKRTAGLSCVTFLEENAYELTIPDEELALWIRRLSEGLTPEPFADFLRAGLMRRT